MNSSELIERLRKAKLVPVIKLEDTSAASRLAKALIDGGIYCAEVTFRAQGAEKVIADMKRDFPEMLIGAGTVLSPEQCGKAIDAGAEFCVAPGLNPRVVSCSLERGVPFVPGIANASQIEQAMELGVTFVKFFPAEQAGGLPYIKALSAPYSEVCFMPTGGINENNIMDYLAFNKVVCCGGSWIVPDKLVKAEDWDGITELCRKALKKINAERT